MNADYTLLKYDKIPSTQTLARKMIADGKCADKTIIMAAAQSSGRGRGTRKWVSHHGNLYASFIYKIEERRPALSYSFAVAACESMLSLGVPTRIKWPNDLLADSKKIAGILLEYSGDFLIVGIGINIGSNPTVDAAYKTTKARKYIKGLTPTDVLGELIKNFEKWRTADFERVRERWTELSMAPEAEIKYRGKAATYCGLNEHGALIIRVGGKYELVYGDEVFV